MAKNQTWEQNCFFFLYSRTSLSHDESPKKKKTAKKIIRSSIRIVDFLRKSGNVKRVFFFFLRIACARIRYARSKSIATLRDCFPSVKLIKCFPGSVPVRLRTLMISPIYLTESDWKKKKHEWELTSARGFWDFHRFSGVIRVDLGPTDLSPKTIIKPRLRLFKIILDCAANKNKKKKKRGKKLTNWLCAIFFFFFLIDLLKRFRAPRTVARKPLTYCDLLRPVSRRW